MRKFVFLFTMLLYLSIAAFSQNSPISGQVRTETGEPIPFATVRVKGSNVAVSADKNGNFSISAGPGATLVISSAGLQTQEIAVNNQSTIAAVLRNSTSLQEVVVTALGVTRGKEKLGYSASTFRTDDITRTAPVSPLDALQGKVAGADISTVGGQPGASSKIILRGYSSLQGSNQALIIVDGVPFSNNRLASGTRGNPLLLNAQGGQDFGNGLNDLNPNDIETITVLKGAAATSLYGSRAQNGVVLVTTKKGRAGQLRVDFNSSAVSSSVGRLPELQNVWGQGWNGFHYKEENGSWGPKMDGAERLWGSTVDNSRLIKPFSPVEDNIRDFYDSGLELNNSLSLRGGNETANFFFSYGNVFSDGVIPSDADSYRRNTLALRGQLKASDRFTLNTSFNYINKIGKTVSSDDDEAGSSTFENILQIPRDVHLTDFKDYNNKFFNVDNYFTPYAANPYFTIYENGNLLKSDRFFGNADFQYKITNGLDIQWRTGIDVTNSRLKDWQAIEKPKPGSWRGPNPTNFEGASYTAKVGGLRERGDFVGEVNSDLFVNYNYDIFTDINLSGFVGGNYNQRQRRELQTRITELTIPGFYNLSNSSNPPTSETFESRRKLFGAFAQANISFKEFLYLALNARNDWSSTLPKGKRAFFYPGANLSLVVSKLADLSSAKVDYLKVRAAYGKTGNDAAPYLLESVLVPGDILLGFGNLVFPLNGVSGFELSNVIGNKALEPEITTEIELGAEAKLFNNRLGFDFSVYRKLSDGQIINVPVKVTFFLLGY
jgi:TonB-linked SusC/RagA family outer membrane protein